MSTGKDFFTDPTGYHYAGRYREIAGTVDIVNLVRKQKYNDKQSPE